MSLLYSLTELLSTFLDDNTDKFTKALYEKVQEIKVSKESSSSSSSKKRSARVSDNHIVRFYKVGNFSHP